MRYVDRNTLGVSIAAHLTIQHGGNPLAWKRSEVEATLDRLATANMGELSRMDSEIRAGGTAEKYGLYARIAEQPERMRSTITRIALSNRPPAVQEH